MEKNNLTDNNYLEKLAEKRKEYEKYFKTPSFNIDDASSHIAYVTEHEGRDVHKLFEDLKKVATEHLTFAQEVLTELYMQKREANVINKQLLYNQTQAAKLLGVKRETILKWVRDDELIIHEKSDKQKLIHKKTLRQFANKHLTKNIINNIKDGITSFLTNSHSEEKPFSITIIGEDEQEVVIDALYFTRPELRRCYRKINKIDFLNKIEHLIKTDK